MYAFVNEHAEVQFLSFNQKGKSFILQAVNSIPEADDEPDTETGYGCPHCGSYEGDAVECPECGHGQ